MDVLFDGLDRLIEAARHRFPVLTTALSLVVWCLVAAGAAYVVGTQWPELGAALAVGPLFLLVVVGIWGLGRLGWPVWPLGVGTLVLVGGIFAPQAEQWNTAWGWLVSLLVFVYVQVFLGALVAVDELRRRREHRRGREESPATDRTARRRVLQLKVLVATQLLVIGTPVGDLQAGIDAMTKAGGPPDIVKIGAVLVLLVGTPTVFLLAFVGVFVRGRRLAFAVAIGILALSTIYLAVLPPASRSALVIEDGWLVLTTTYLWVKAATKWYWPTANARRADEDPAARPAWIQSPTY